MSAISRRDFVRVAAVASAGSVGAVAAMAAMTEAHAAGVISPELSALIQAHGEAVAGMDAAHDPHDAIERVYYATQHLYASKEEAEKALGLDVAYARLMESVNAVEAVEQDVMQYDPRSWADLVAKARLIGSNRAWCELMSDDADALLWDILTVADLMEGGNA